MNIVSFPGFGIDEWTINSVAFTLFGKFSVRWYGIFITLGILLAVLYVCYRGKKNENIKSDDIIDIALLTVILGIIGSRVYYVVTDSGNTYDSFLDVIAIWNGGLAIYGAIIGGMLGIAIVCIIKKINVLQLFDMAAPGVLIAQAIGRWGNFCNGEAHGVAFANGACSYDFFNFRFSLNTDSGILHFTRMGLKSSSTAEFTYYAPTFLFESVWNVVGFILINLFYKRKKYHGQVTYLYFLWYSFGRMFIEGFRSDSLYIRGTNIRVSQALSLLLFIASITLLIVFGIRNKGKESPLKAIANAKAEKAEYEGIVETEEDDYESILGGNDENDSDLPSEFVEIEPTMSKNSEQPVVDDSNGFSSLVIDEEEENDFIPLTSEEKVEEIPVEKVEETPVEKVEEASVEKVEEAPVEKPKRKYTRKPKTETPSEVKVEDNSEAKTEETPAEKPKRKYTRKPKTETPSEVKVEDNSEAKTEETPTEKPKRKYTRKPKTETPKEDTSVDNQ